MDAPKPITPENIELINDDQIKDKFFLNKNGSILKIKLIDEYIYFIVDKQNEEKKFQLKLNYEEITNKIPYFKISNKLSDIFKNIVQLFNKDKFIMEFVDNKIKLIIKLMNIFGTEEQHEFLLYQIELNDKEKIELLKNKIKELENKIVEINEDKKEFKKDVEIKINKLIEEKEEYKNEMDKKINKLNEEKKEMNIKIDELSKENITIKNELKKIYQKLNSIGIDKLNYKENKNIRINEKKTELKINHKRINSDKLNYININDNLDYSEYSYDYLIYLKERTSEILIYDKQNKFIKKTLKNEDFKCQEKFEVFPFKSKFVNLGKSLLLTGGIIKEEKLNKCYLISVIEVKLNNKLRKNEINITSYGDLKEKREEHSILYLPNKNFVFVCSGFLTKTCEYTNISKGTWEEIKPLNKIRINASMAYVNGKYIYIFCGSSLEGENENSYYLNDLEYFDVDNFEKGWTPINFINEKGYNLSWCALSVIPVSKNSFLICGGHDGKVYKAKTYKIICNDHEHPSIEEININNNATYIHNMFCKIGEAYFNFDFSSRLYKFDYKNLNLGIFNEKQILKNNK